MASTVSGKFLWSTGTSPSLGFTVLRTRGYVSSILLAATAAGDGFFGAHGIYMMTEDAFAIGVTAALDPFLDSSSDMWIWHQFFDCRSLSGAEGGVDAMASVARFQIDSKAMRKSFDPDRVMVGVTGVVLSGAATMETNAATRQLLMS